MNAAEELIAKIDKVIGREFRNHVKNEGGMIVGAPKLQIALTRAIAEVCGPLIAASDEKNEITRTGWNIVRKSGREMKVRGNATGFFGYEATHIATGHVEKLPPSSGGDVPPEMVGKILDQLEQIIEKFGSMENFRKGGAKNGQEKR